MIYTVKRVYPIVLRIHIDLCVLRSIIYCISHTTATICSWLMAIIQSRSFFIVCTAQFCSILNRNLKF